MKDRILHKLREIELQHNVEILFAVESGSRAWGFASPDSDYDIRFVYRSKSETYLSLWQARDTIEFMTAGELDGSGWDLKKATLLLAKSNASFLGWLFSPIVYLQNGETLNQMKNLANANFNPVSGFHHYHSMNKAFIEQLEQGSIDLKTFFYAARTAMNANWILHFGSIPPVRFQELYTLIDQEHANLLDALIDEKSKAKERAKALVDTRLITLVNKMVMENTDRQDALESRKADKHAFDRFFIKALS